MTPAGLELTPLGALAVDPARFSARAALGLDPGHIAELADRLRDGEPLDPIAVWRSGGKLHVVDGFHRVAAYGKAGWPGAVPVRVFGGDITVALKLAVVDNAKARLPLTPEERQDFAWRVVRLEQEAKRRRDAREPLSADDRALAALSKAGIAKMTGTSARGVAKMREAWGVAQATGAELSGLWWRDRRAVLGADDETLSDEEREQRREQRAKQLAHDLRALSPAWRRDPEIGFRALKLVIGEERLTQLAQFLKVELEDLHFTAVDPGREF